VNLRIILVLGVYTALAACHPPADGTGEPASVAVLQTGPGTGAPTAADAVAFVARAESRLAELGQYLERMTWVQNNFITSDTEWFLARANEALTAAQVGFAAEAARYAGLEGLDRDTARKLEMLRTGIVIPAPSDPAKNAEQAEIGAKLKSLYGKGKYCRSENDCLALGDLEDILAHSRDPAELLEAWDGWHRIAVPMKGLYAREVELANEGARDLGFADLGSMWRSSYEMDPSAFAAELDRVWQQIRPLYESLHCHVRAKLGEFYGTGLVPQDGLIPAHLLGNMWAQDWVNIYDLVGPQLAGADYDVTTILQEEGFDPIRMVRTGEAFFTSLGFDQLPETFWERSLFTKPEDREVICHAAAYNIDEKEDVRIKMCIKVNEEDFKTIHHELGHDYYYLAYNQQSYLYRYSANDGFHEAVGDTLSLSITPRYLVQIGLLPSEPDSAGDIGLLLKAALDKVAFAPFGLLVDQWRWKVFSGEVGPEGYNQLWWQLRREYQGISAPNDRPPDAFDPGAKFHVPANFPYARYLLANVLQFQFFRAMCDIAGNEGPVHRCSFYRSEEAGSRLKTMLEMGRSQPWPKALEALTGSSQVEASAMLDYFAPLQEWLDRQNAGRQCGWD